ncbi:phage baseplate protein [Morganella morganii]|uniref:phage baseplate protein n=1 Tax=Morganella morganii TaxID=582 RepID=UPI003CFDFA97
MDLLSGFNTSRRATVVTRSIGEFELDAVTVEGHESNMRLTENPVESGADIADHAILEPKEITVTGIMVGYEPPQHFKNMLGNDLAFMDEYPMPMEIRASTRQAEAMYNQIVGQAQDIKAQVGKVLAPWYPEAAGMANDSSPSLDRVGKAYEDLLSIQKKGEPITVQTGIKQYENMLIISIGVTQQYDGSAEFSLTLREIFIVESQKAQGIHPDVKASSPTKKNMGKTQPKKVENGKTVLREMVGGK